MRRLIPEPGPTTVARELAAYRPWEKAYPDRPFVAVNFAATVDGRATIGGVSGPIGSATDTAMFAALRTRFDAVMIGANTMRTERYGRLINSPEQRERRERIGLPHDPLMVIISASMELPWDAPLFSAGAGRVLVLTTSRAQPPPTATPLRLIRQEGAIDLSAALAQLRHQRGIRALLCEGGPHLHGELQRAGLVDDLFLTIAPKLAGGPAPTILEGGLSAVAELELTSLLEDDGELFARYRRR